MMDTRKCEMRTREMVLAYGLSFPDTYQDAPFHDENWQLVRIRESKKAFLWTYERNKQLCINVKVDPQWRDLWRATYSAVLPGYHQNKEHWNTVILDGTAPDEDVKRMIAESYDLVRSGKRYEVKLLTPQPINMAALFVEELNAELEKGYTDMLDCRTKPARKALTELNEHRKCN